MVPFFKTKMDEIDTLFKSKPFKNHTLSGRTSPLRTRKGVPPPSRALGTLNATCTHKIGMGLRDKNKCFVPARFCVSS